MHSFELNPSNVPAFLIKLWKLVEDSSCDDLISWTDNGLSFLIKDQARFASELLPQYFKHNNMASFVRQLNMYGFRKVMNYEKSGLRTDNNEMEFQHSFFLRDQSELLEHIKRKIPNTRVIAEPLVRSNAKDILTDLTSIRDKQDSMDNMLMKMKQENELLWKELTNMRQKHKQQEQVIEKVIHFLVQVIRNQPVDVGIQRTARMIHDSPNYKGKSSQITTVDFLRKKPECIIVEDKNVNTPFIHEVEEFEVEEPLSVGSCKSTSSSKNLTTDKSPGPNIISLSPAMQPSRECETPFSHTSENPFESSSLNSPIENVLHLEPLNILEPFQSSSPTICGEESVLGLDYINTTDDAESLNPTPNKNVIAVPSKTIARNVMSIPEEKNNKEVIMNPGEMDICNVISIPVSNDITDVITISQNNDIGNVISIPEGTDNINVISIPDETDISNVISIPERSDIITAANKSSRTSASSKTIRPLVKVESSTALCDFYTPSCIDDLKASTLGSVKSPLNIISKHDFIDPLMSDSLHTPQVSLCDDDLDVPHFSLGNCKKETQCDRNYPSTSAASNKDKSSTAKNTLSNHLLIVEEELNRLQDNIATNSWDVDTDKLLGLFSSDGMVGNESLVEQLTDGISIKKEPDDSLDDDLIQLTPQILGVDIDELRSPFLDHLDPTLAHSDNLSEIIPDKKPDFLAEPLTSDTDQVAILGGSDYLSNEETGSSKRRRNASTRGKRRKLK